MNTHMDGCGSVAAGGDAFADSELGDTPAFVFAETGPGGFPAAHRTPKTAVETNA